MRKSVFRSCVGACLAVAVSAAADQVQIDRIDYHGWKGCYRLSGRAAELVFVPQIGRIMRFGRIGGPNVLWENPGLKGRVVRREPKADWLNYGGDKLWPSPQRLWNWPPDPALDGASCEVRIARGALVATGPKSERTGIRFTRRIALSGDGSTVDLENTMTDTSAHPVEFGVWEIAQTNNPVIAFLPSAVTRDAPLGWSPLNASHVDMRFVRSAGGYLYVTRNPKSGFKLGSSSPHGVVVADCGPDRFAMSASRAPGNYPENGDWLMMFASGDPLKYVELEISGPLVKLQPGQSTTFRVTWRLGNANMRP